MKKNVPFGTAVLIIIIAAVIAGLIWFRATGSETLEAPPREAGAQAPADAGFQAREEPTPAEAAESATEAPAEAEEPTE